MPAVATELTNRLNVAIETFELVSPAGSGARLTRIYVFRAAVAEPTTLRVVAVPLFALGVFCCVKESSVTGNCAGIREGDNSKPHAIKTTEIRQDTNLGLGMSKNTLTSDKEALDGGASASNGGTC